MSDILKVWNQIDGIFTELTIYREFKTGHRSLFGLDGISLLLIAFSIVAGIGLLLFGLVNSKLLLPLLLLFLSGNIFLYGDQFLSPMEARMLETSNYRTGWSPGYVWFVSLAFAGMGLLLTYYWAEIPFRLSKTEPCDGRFAILAPKLPTSAARQLTKSSQSTKKLTQVKKQAKPVSSTKH